MLGRKGVLVVISDFYEEPDAVLSAIAPLRARGHDVHTPTLTGCGERAHLCSPEITLDRFASRIDDQAGIAARVMQTPAQPGGPDPHGF